MRGLGVGPKTETTEISAEIDFGHINFSAEIFKSNYSINQDIFAKLNYFKVFSGIEIMFLRLPLSSHASNSKSKCKFFEAVLQVFQEGCVIASFIKQKNFGRNFGRIFGFPAEISVSAFSVFFSFGRPLLSLKLKVGFKASLSY